MGEEAGRTLQREFQDRAVAQRNFGGEKEVEGVRLIILMC